MYRAWGWIRRAGTALLWTSSVLQLGGFPGDVPTWLRFLYPYWKRLVSTLTERGLAVALLGLGIVLLVPDLVRLWRWTQAQRSAPTPRVVPSAYVPRGFAEQIEDKKRERAADPLVFIQADLGRKEYHPAELDRLSPLQREKLLTDPIMRERWRGRKLDGSWPRFRLEGGAWPSREEIARLSEDERNEMLTGRRELIQWYLDDPRVRISELDKERRSLFAPHEQNLARMGYEPTYRVIDGDGQPREWTRKEIDQLSTQQKEKLFTVHPDLGSWWRHQ